MTSIIKVDTLQDTGGNTILSSDGAGKVLTSKVNYPAFQAYSTTSQSLTNITFTKVQFDTEIFDTDNAFDNTTNYRFTVPTGKGGKYLVFYEVCVSSDNTSDINQAICSIYKNGTSITQTSDTFQANPIRRYTPSESLILDLTAGDYLEVFTYVYFNTGAYVFGSTTLQRVVFGALRIGD